MDPPPFAPRATSRRPPSSGQIGVEAHVLSGETPPSLAELPPLPETERRRRADPVHQGVTTSDGLTETEPGAVGCREMPTILRLEGVGDVSEFGPLAHHCGRTLDDEVQTIIESVASSREHASRVLREVLGLAFGWTGAEVQPPSRQTPNSGVTCGRPSGRTVDNQYTSAPCRSASAVAHSVATAPSLLNAPRSVTGSRSTISRLNLHRSLQ